MNGYRYETSPVERLVVVREDGVELKPRFRAGKVPTAGWGSDDRNRTLIILAILDDAIGSHQRADRVLMRVKHRVLAIYKPPAKPGDPVLPWSTTQADIMTMVADVEKVERETAMSRRMASQEPAPVVSDRGGGDIAWSKEPKITPNLEKKP